MGNCSSLPTSGLMGETTGQQPYKLSPSRPKLGQDHHGSTGGLIGLTNLGNTCFMNSALQCLSNTPPLMQYFLSSKWREELNPSNPIGFGGHIACSFGELIALLWSQEESNYASSPSVPSNSGVVSTPSDACVTPRSFKSTVSRYFNQFSGYDQHDAQELLVFLLDGLHEDLNRVKKKPYIEEDDNDDNINVFELADRSWANYLLRNRSIIVDMAQGQLKSTLTCLKCGHTSVKFDPYMHLSIPVNKNNNRNNGGKCSLLDCITEFSKPELLSGDSQWRCPKCKEFRDATKTMSVWSYPPILIIHLKRFHVGNQGSRRKIDTLVEFPVEAPISLVARRSSSKNSANVGSNHNSNDINDNTLRRYSSRYMSNNIKDDKIKSGSDEENVENIMYSLYSVCNHFGSLHGGHYTAYAKNYDNDKWYCYNDSVVNEIKDPTSAVCTSKAYVLFFKMDGMDFSTPTEIATEFRSRSSSEKTTVGTSSSNSSYSNSIYIGNNRESFSCTQSGRIIISGKASIDPAVLDCTHVESNDPMGVRNAQYTPTKKNKSHTGRIFSGGFFARVAGVFGRPLPNISPPHSQIKPIEVPNSNNNDNDNDNDDDKIVSSISRMIASSFQNKEIKGVDGRANGNSRDSDSNSNRGNSSSSMRPSLESSSNRCSGTSSCNIEVML